jgi:hypothetical protein
MHSVSQNPDDSSALDFEGTPAELAELFDDTMGDDSVASYIEVLGLAIEHVHHGAQHNGQPAYGFSLGDHSLPNRNIGRLTLIDSKEWDVLIPVWTVHYHTEQAAAEQLERFTARSTRPLLVSVTLDFAYTEATLAEALANVSAAWGISCTVVNEHGPGGGWPEVKFFGFTDRIEKMLRADGDEYGYDFNDEEVAELLGS